MFMTVAKRLQRCIPAFATCRAAGRSSDVDEGVCLSRRRAAARSLGSASKPAWLRAPPPTFFAPFVVAHERSGRPSRARPSDRSRCPDPSAPGSRRGSHALPSTTASRPDTFIPSNAAENAAASCVARTRALSASSAHRISRHAPRAGRCVSGGLKRREHCPAPVPEEATRVGALATGTRPRSASSSSKGRDRSLRLRAESACRRRPRRRLERLRTSAMTLRRPGGARTRDEVARCSRSIRCTRSFQRSLGRDGPAPSRGYRTPAEPPAPGVVRTRSRVRRRAGRAGVDDGSCGRPAGSSRAQRALGEVLMTERGARRRARSSRPARGVGELAAAYERPPGSRIREALVGRFAQGHDVRRQPALGGVLGPAAACGTRVEDLALRAEDRELPPLARIRLARRAASDLSGGTASRRCSGAARDRRCSTSSVARRRRS